MAWAKWVNRNVDEVFHFYNPDNGGGKENLPKRVYNHRFFLYASVTKYIWEGVAAGSVITRFFDDGKYDAEKIALVVATTPLMILSPIYYGAFWAKLGDKDLLKESWKQNKKETAKEIFLSSLKGNVLHHYYKLRLGTDVIEDATSFGLEKICEGRPITTRAINEAREITFNILDVYHRYIGPKIC